MFMPKIEKILLERFGEPIGDAEATVGVADEQGKEVEEVAPPGYEKVVKKLKKNKNVDNPWAVAWAMKNKQ